MTLFLIISCESANEEGGQKGNRIAFVTPTKVCLINENGTSFKILKEGVRANLFTWTRNGDGLILDINGKFIIIDTLGNTKDSILPNSYSAFSPNSFGDNLIVSGLLDSASSDFQIFSIDQNGNVVNVYTEGGKSAINPTLSLVSRKIAYTQQDGENSKLYEIYKQNIDSPYLKVNLTNDTLLNKFPSCSPDGKKIAYLHRTDKGESIWVMDENGRNKRMILKEIGAEISSWSPDSQKIIVQSFNEKGQFLIVNVNDTSKRSYVNVKELNGEEWAYFPVYSPK